MFGEVTFISSFFHLLSSVPIFVVRLNCHFDRFGVSVWFLSFSLNFWVSGSAETQMDYRVKCIVLAQWRVSPPRLSGLSP